MNADTLEKLADLTPVNLEKVFAEYMAEAYPEEIEIAGCTFYASDILRELDPIAWRAAFYDWVSAMEKENWIVSFDNGATHYYVEDIKNL